MRYTSKYECVVDGKESDDGNDVMYLGRGAYMCKAHHEELEREAKIRRMTEVKCTGCAGSGMATCMTCYDDGMNDCPECGGSHAVECERCEGAGKQKLDQMSVEAYEARLKSLMEKALKERKDKQDVKYR